MEMLVAVLLMTLLIGVAIFAFRYQIIAIKKTKNIGINRVIAYNQLKSSLESIKFYVVDDYDMLNKSMKNLHFYFQGGEKEISYITQNPIFSTQTSLVRLKCDEEKLLYKEEKLYGTMDFLRPTLPETSREITLYNNLDGCAFKYLKEDVISENLLNTIPESIMIHLSVNELESEIYVKMKNDNNTSKYDVYEALFSDE